MKTRKLYYEDQYLREFSALIEEVVEYKGKTAVVLDKTAFFPEGGGQSSDKGLIGGAEVADVQIDGGRIFHFVDPSFDLKPGETVECSIDWKKRFSDMQQHSAEHIFSGIIHRLFGLENVGFHLGETAVTFDFSRVLTEEELETAETLANRAIFENREIRPFFPTEEELSGLSFRSKKEISEDLRLVEIDGVDLCACCAPHVKRTGEIGIAKIISTEKIRGGSRIYFLAGERALSDIRLKMKQNKRVAVLLSEKEESTFFAVERLKGEKENAEFNLFSLKSELMRLRSEAKSGEVIVDFCDFSGDDLRRYADLLSKKAGRFALALSGEDGPFRFVLISRTGEDINAVIEKLRENFPVRGGGRNGIIQGTIEASRADIEALIGK